MLEQATASMAPSLWASLASWFTSTTLFLFLNLTIATIAITSKLHKHQNPEIEIENNNTLGRSPSNMLARLKSINFYNNNNNNNNILDQQNPGFGRSPSNLLYRLKSINFYSYLSNEHYTVVSADPPTPATKETVTHFPPRNEEEEEEEWGHGESDDQVEEDLGDDRSLDEVYSKLQGKKQQLVTRSKSDTKPASGEVPAKLPKKMKKSATTKSAFSHFKESDVVPAEARRPETTREGQNGKRAGDDDHEVDAKADDFINRFKQQLKLQRIDSILRYKEMLGRASGKNS